MTAKAYIVEEYEEHLSDAPNRLAIKGKTLQQANVEHAQWMFFYDQKRIELYILKKHMEKEVARVRGKLWVQYTEVHTRELNARDKDNYINQEKSFLNKDELMLIVQELHDKYAALVDAYKSRGYALNNIVKLRTSSIENDVI
jgi:hypothetical protein